MRSQLAKYQRESAMSAEEMYQLEKNSILEKNKVLINLDEIKEFGFQLYLAEYIEKKYHITNVFGKRK